MNYPHILFSSDGWKCYKLRRLYFIWVCRDIESFRWFADLLCMLHNKVRGVVWRDPDNLNARYSHTTHLAFYRAWQPCSKQVSSSSSLGCLIQASFVLGAAQTSLGIHHQCFIAALPCSSSLGTYLCPDYFMRWKERPMQSGKSWVALSHLASRQIEKGVGFTIPSVF